MIGQNPNDMRTAARRVRGLGSARAGTKEFWHQRVTSVAGIPPASFVFCKIKKINKMK